MEPGDDRLERLLEQPDEFTPEQIAEMERDAATVEALEASPTPALVLEAAHAMAQVPRHTDLPLYNELGYEMLSYRCFRCGRADIIADSTWAIYKDRGVHPCCLPCTYPDKWKWRTDPDTGHEYIQPLDVPKVAHKVGEREAQALETLHYELLEKLERRDFLVELKGRVDAELAAVEQRIGEVRTEMPAAQAAVVAAQNDPDRELKNKITGIEEELAKLKGQQQTILARADRNVRR